MSTLPTKLKEWKQELQRHPSPELAQAIIHDFFRHRTISELKEELWMLTVAVLAANENEAVQTGIDRHNRLFFYEHCCLLLEAVEVIRRKSVPASL